MRKRQMELFINERKFALLQRESEQRVAMWEEVLNSDETYEQKIDKLAVTLVTYENEYMAALEANCEFDAWYQRLYEEFDKYVDENAEAA